MIKYADESMFLFLTEIWKQSFGDSEAYIRMFLTENFHRIRTVIKEVSEIPVSVAYFLPVTIWNSITMTSEAGWYLYAAATLPEYRGKGYFSQILAFVKENFSEPVLLVPGETSLIDYYQNNGLTVCQKAIRFKFHKDELSGMENSQEWLSWKEISEDDYFSARELALRDINHIHWDKPFIEYICKENKYWGGKQMQFEMDGLRFTAMVTIQDKELLISEILCSERMYFDSGDLDQNKFFLKAVHILLHQTDCVTANVCIQPTVMCNQEILDSSSFYFNLTLG